MHRRNDHPIEIKRKVYMELFRLAISPKILIGADLMVEFEKEMDCKDVGKTLLSRDKGFGIT